MLTAANRLVSRAPPVPVSLTTTSQELAELRRLRKRTGDRDGELAAARSKCRDVVELVSAGGNPKVAAAIRDGFVRLIRGRKALTKHQASLWRAVDDGADASAAAATNGGAGAADTATLEARKAVAEQHLKDAELVLEGLRTGWAVQQKRYTGLKQLHTDIRQLIDEAKAAPQATGGGAGGAADASEARGARRAIAGSPGVTNGTAARGHGSGSGSGSTPPAADTDGAAEDDADVAMAKDEDATVDALAAKADELLKTLTSVQPKLAPCLTTDGAVAKQGTCA